MHGEKNRLAFAKISSIRIDKFLSFMVFYYKPVKEK